MILGDDGARLSKRHGAVSVMQYRDDGYLPQALLNYLVRLGWSHGDQEVFSVDEMIALFDIGDVNRKASAFNTDKLDWLNQHYMKSLPPEEVAEQLAWHFADQGIELENGPPLTDVVVVQAERVKTLKEMASQSRVFYEGYDELDPQAAKKHLRPVALEPLQAMLAKLQSQHDWSVGPLHDVIDHVATELEVGMGKVAQPLRIAVTGSAVSPSIDKTLWLLGKRRSLQGIGKALKYIEARIAAM
jgi:glutamyl-tRNA synthetase